MADSFPLCRAQEAESLVVVKIGCEPPVRSRLCDLGLTEGSRIRYLYSAVFGDPKAYLVKGAVLAIRDQDAEKILCRKEQMYASDQSCSVR